MRIFSIAAAAAAQISRSVGLPRPHRPTDRHADAAGHASACANATSAKVLHDDLREFSEEIEDFTDDKVFSAANLLP
jgi:hypothetical protein